MLIHRGNYDKLSAYMRKSFIDRMQTHLEKFFPKETAHLGPDDLRGIVDEGIDRADRFHVLREKDVARFIDLDFLTAPPFEEQPEMKWARDILEDHSMGGAEKMKRIYKRLPDHLAKKVGKKP